MFTRTEQSDPIMPLIHLNGNSRESLLDGYINARRDLQKAIDSFYAIDMHPRNYYPLAEGSWEKAKQDHQEIIDSLHKITLYLEAHIRHLVDGT